MTDNYIQQKIMVCKMQKSTSYLKMDNKYNNVLCSICTRTHGTEPALNILEKLEYHNARDNVRNPILKTHYISHFICNLCGFWTRIKPDFTNLGHFLRFRDLTINHTLTLLSYLILVVNGHRLYVILSCLEIDVKKGPGCYCCISE